MDPCGHTDQRRQDTSVEPQWLAIAGCDILQRIAVQSDPDAVVWRRLRLVGVCVHVVFHSKPPRAVDTGHSLFGRIGSSFSGPAGPRTGLQALRNVFREWGIMSEGDLTGSERMVSQAPSGNHISARAQEHILFEASASDARVVLLESVYVVLTLHRGRRWERR